jgi:PAS domain S-box-containing protein
VNNLKFPQHLNFNLIINDQFSAVQGDIIFVDSKDIETLDFERLKNNFNRIYAIAKKFNKDLFKELYNLGVSDIIYYNFIDHEITTKITDYYNERLKFIENITLNRIIDKSKNSIVITDADGNIEYVNDYFLKTTGYELEEVIGENTNILKSGEHEDRYYSNLWKKILKNKLWEGYFINKDKYGRYFYEDARITPIEFEDEGILNFVKIAKNVTQEKMLEDQLKINTSVAIKVMESLFPEKYAGAINFDYFVKQYNELGGDIITFDKNNNKFFISLIDITGHDLSSTLIAINAMSTMKDLNNEKSIGAIVDQINKNLFNINDHSGVSKYATGIFLEIDLDTGMIDYINAGHPDMIVTNNKDELVNYTSNNIMLGVIDSFTFNTQSIAIASVEDIFVFSDGLIENLNVNYDQSIELLKTRYLEKYKNPTFNLKQFYNDLNFQGYSNDDISMFRITFDGSQE